MTTSTPNLNLVLYDEVNDASKTFLSFRNDMSGTEESNMKKLDDFAGQVTEKMNELEAGSKITDDDSGESYRFGKDAEGVYLILESTSES